jgi:hypothetical protein
VGTDDDPVILYDQVLSTSVSSQQEHCLCPGRHASECHDSVSQNRQQWERTQEFINSEMHKHCGNKRNQYCHTLQGSVTKLRSQMQRSNYHALSLCPVPSRPSEVLVLLEVRMINLAVNMKRRCIMAA